MNQPLRSENELRLPPKTSPTTSLPRLASQTNSPTPALPSR